MTAEVWFDPMFGASGDMILGAFIGLGVDPAELINRLELLDLDGWQIDVSEVTRCGISATRAAVTCETQPHSRHWSSIDKMLAESRLDPSVVSGARSTFRRLGEVEAEQHLVDIDEVHFHEVGAVDAIVDIVGAWICWDLIGQPSVACGPFGLGHGTVNAAHGQLPLPAPATSAILTGWAVTSLESGGETVTPTGAAILTTMATRGGHLGTGVLEATSRGAGGRDPSGHPNVLTLIKTSSPTASQLEPCLELTTNLDDCSGEVVAYTIERLLSAGAMDAWATPIVMKKSRPAIQLSALCNETLGAELTSIMMRETGSLGVRRRPQHRMVSDRSMVSVDLDGHQVRVKVSDQGAKPEYDDLAAMARSTGRPLRELSKAALELFDNLG